MELEVIRELDAKLCKCEDIEHEHKKVNKCEESSTYKQYRILGNIEVIHDGQESKTKAESLKSVGLDSK